MKSPNKAPITVSYRWLELLTAAFFAAIGAVVVMDSVRTGFRWGADGPQPGYFPFYIGCVMIIGAAWVGLGILRQWSSEKARAPICSPHQMRLVLQMFVPCVLFVIGVIYLGLYVAGTIYIAAFMMWQGRFGWLRSLLVAIGVSAVLFGLFELWFQVPLPKGPLEALFGY